jgi:hypothetical protein
MQVVYWNSVFAFINVAWIARLLFAARKKQAQSSSAPLPAA